MLSLFPSTWQTPVLQNNDDISAVPLGLRGRIILTRAGQETVQKGRLQDEIICAVTRRSLEGLGGNQTQEDLCMETYACAHIHIGIVWGQVSHFMAHLSLWQLPSELFNISKYIKRQLHLWPRVQEAPSAGSARKDRKLGPASFVLLSLQWIMSLSLNANWTAHHPQTYSTDKINQPLETHKWMGTKTF